MTGKPAVFPAAPPRRHAGMTLIELMIAMLLGLIVIGGMLGIFLSSSETSRRTDDLARIQENARIALELMGRSLREAGGNACGVLPEKIGLTPGIDKNHWWTGSANFKNAVRGYGPADVFPANGGVTRVGGSDAFIAISASAGANAVTRDSPLTVRDFRGLAATVLFGCNNDTGTGVLFRLPGAPTQNTLAVALPQPVDTVARLSPEAWFVGENGRGGASLYRTGGDGIPEEIAPDVTNMQILYLLPKADDYAPASAIADDDWPKVVAVRIRITLARAAGAGEAAITRAIAQTVMLRNRSTL